MTDEEKLAEEYVKSVIDVNAFDWKIVREICLAFLAGLKAGRSEWHDLRENPNDLPERISFFSKTVINQIGTPCHYNYALECWQNWSNTEIETPIAWCEIPQFKDKE